MDWSLVLVSQGIESQIERDPEAGRWLLVVHEPDLARAVDALRRYTAENRPHWQHTLPGVGLLFDWRSVGCLLFLALIFALDASGRTNLRPAGVMDNALVHAGQWWRLFTAVTLHGDLTHLVLNLSTGLLLLGLTMAAYGYGVGMFAAYLTGVAAFGADLMFLPETHRSLGASGMILGAIGLLAAQWIALLRHGLTARDLAMRGVLSACLLLVLLGFSPNEKTDLLAHVAGFAAGLLFGAAMAFVPQRFRHGPWPNRAALALTLALVLVPWWFALKR